MTQAKKPYERNRPQAWLSCALGLFLLVLSITPTLVFAQDNGTDIPPYQTTVLVAGSDNTAFNLRFIEVLQKKLGPTVEIRNYSPARSLTRPGTLVITLGSRALSRVQQQNPEPPTLALMVNKAQFEPYVQRGARSISAIYNDPSLLKQALLGQMILPHTARIALLVRPGEESAYDDFIQSLDRYDLDARVFIVDGNDSLIATLSRALSYGDFLLGLPDEMIFNPRTIKHILLTAYRRNRIVIGPNRAFVGAGSLASTYTPMNVVVDDVVRHVQAFRTSGQLLPPEYPSDFSVDVNYQVARSLNIPVPGTDALETRLKERLDEFPEGVSP